MIEIADYQIMLDVLLANRAKIEAEIDQLKADFIKDHSPFQVGDVVNYQDGFKLYKVKILEIYINAEGLVEKDLRFKAVKLTKGGGTGFKTVFAMRRYFSKVED